MTRFTARIVVEGEAEGPVTVWSTPLSFWGGFDSASGRVIDRSHPAFGATISGRILAMPSGRGSSSTSSVLAEAVRCGTAPAAILLTLPDPIITVGSIVAQRLYGRTCPILLCDPSDIGRLVDGRRARISLENGRAVIAAVEGP